jgi:hypothetical protein
VKAAATSMAVISSARYTIETPVPLSRSRACASIARTQPTKPVHPRTTVYGAGRARLDAG